MPWLPGTSPNRRDKYQEERGFSGQQIVLLEFQDDGTVIYGNGTYENGKLISVQGRYTATGLAAAIAGASLTFSPQYQLKASFSVTDQALTGGQIMSTTEGVESGGLVAYIYPGFPALELDVLSNRLLVTGAVTGFTTTWVGVYSQGSSYRAMGRVYKATVTPTATNRHFWVTTIPGTSLDIRTCALRWYNTGYFQIEILNDALGALFRDAPFSGYALTPTPVAIVLGGYSGTQAPFYPGQNPVSFTQGVWFFFKDSRGWRLIWPDYYGTVDNQRLAVMSLDALVYADNLRQLSNLCTGPQSNGLLLRDDMTDTNGTLLPVHTPTHGGAWTVSGDVLEIRTNQLQLVAAAGDSFAVRDMGIVDVVLDALVTPWDNGADASTPGITTRWANGNNCWFLHCSSLNPPNGLILYEIHSGVWTDRGSSVVGLGSGIQYWIRLIVDDDEIQGFLVRDVNATIRVSYTSGANNTVTTHGVGIYQTGTPTTSATIDSVQIFAGRHDSYEDLDLI